MPPSRSLNLAGAYLLIQSSLGEILPRGSGILAAPPLCKPPDKGGGQCGQAGCSARHHAGVGVAQGNGAIALGQRYAEQPAKQRRGLHLLTVDGDDPIVIVGKAQRQQVVVTADGAVHIDAPALPDVGIHILHLLPGGGQGGATPADEIRAQLDLPTRIVNDVLYQLVQAGQLIAVPSGDGEREVAFAPAHDTGTLTVYGVLEAVEASGQTTVDLARNAELTRIDRELENLKETARKSQDNVRLVDLL